MVSKRNVCKVRGFPVSSIPMNPQKRKEDARRFAKKETLARPSPTFFPLSFANFSLFFFLLEGETKAKKAQKGTTRKQTKKKFHHQKACACLSSSCVISSSLL